MTPLLPSLAEVGGVLLLFATIGAAGAVALCPRRSDFRLERLGWSFAIGLGILSLSVPLALATGRRPGWIPALILGLAAAMAGWWGRLPAAPPASGVRRTSWPARLWILAIAAGVAVFALRALTEPMWGNDFLACWGLKGKLIFAEGGVPSRLFSEDAPPFSHPEYPLGLPFLFSSLASLLGAWDDHAIALLFPALQVATLLVLFGWLRRRGLSTGTAGGAAALLSIFAPLYAAYLTGYAEIPLAFFGLLLATSLSDAVDRTDPGALRRTACAALLCAGTKNEGLYFVVAAIAVGFVASRRRGNPAAPLAASLLLPAAAILVGQRIAWGNPPLSDYDFGLLAPARAGELALRARLTARLVGREVLQPGVPLTLAALLAIGLAGRRTAWADRCLILALGAEIAYLVLPAFAVYPGSPELGPVWIVTTSLGRTSSALSPLVAAGLAGRLGWLASANPTVAALDDA